jgi:hypothetical protein
MSSNGIRMPEALQARYAYSTIELGFTLPATAIHVAASLRIEGSGSRIQANSTMNPKYSLPAEPPPCIDATR